MSLCEMIVERDLYQEGWQRCEQLLARRPLHAVLAQALKLVRTNGFTGYVRGLVDRLNEECLA